MSRRAGCAAFAVIALVAASCSSTPKTAGSPTPSPTTESPSPSPSPKPSPSVPAAVTGKIQFGGEVYGIASAGNVLWAENGTPNAPRIYGINARTRKSFVTFPGSAPTIIGTDLWFNNGAEVVRADPATGKVREKFKPPEPGHLAVGAGSIWIVAGETTGTLYRIDRTTKKVKATLRMPDGEPKDIAFYKDAIWIPIDGSDVVVKVNPKTNRIASQVPTGSRPHSLATGFGAVWVTNHGEASVSRIDAAKGRVVATIQGPGENVAITVEGNFVYAATPDGIAKIDPKTNKVAKTSALWSGIDYYDVAVANESLWVTTGGADAHQVWQIPLF